MRVAIDAMGGDLGPPAIVEGVAAFLRGDDNDTELTLVGREDALAPLLQSHGLSKESRVAIHHASEIVGMDEKLSTIRHKRDASIWRAIELVRDDKADAVMALGNTAAAVAASHLRLRLIEGVDRAGIAIAMPSDGRDTIVIDMGANTETKVEHLIGYAVMATIYCETVLQTPNPSVGLLNVGEELGKGSDFLREAYEALGKAPINFLGNVEGGDIFYGKVDIIVCDGLVGNAVLKASQAVAGMVVKLLKGHLDKSIRRKLGGALAKPAFDELRASIDYSEWGGAPLLGVNGVVVIGHGRSNARAVENAIKVSRDAAAHQITTKIRDRIKSLVVPNGKAAKTGKADVAVSDPAAE